MLILDIIVAVFAAWGLFCAAKFFADGVLTPKSARPRPVVKLKGDESAQQIAELCENARRAIIPNRGEVFLLVAGKNEFSEGVKAELDKLNMNNVKIVYEREEQNEPKT